MCAGQSQSCCCPSSDVRPTRSEGEAPRRIRLGAGGGTMARKSEILMKYMHKVWIPAQIAALKKDPRMAGALGSRTIAG